MTSPKLTTDLIVKALRSSPYALTRTALAVETGLSYNTIKANVETIPGIKKLDGNRYKLGSATIASGSKLKWRSHFTTTTGRHIEVEQLELPDAVDSYEKLASRIPLALPAQLDPLSDPRDMAQVIGDYAIFLASIAAKLEEQQDNPEWFTALGGTDGTYIPSITKINPYTQEADDVPVRRVR